jgi:hypothetical protein
MPKSTSASLDRKAPDEVSEEPEARWANQFNTGFRPHIIELVFYQNNGKNRKQRIVTRIITSPDDAKELLSNLRETIDKYEEMYGPIRTYD